LLTSTLNSTPDWMKDGAQLAPSKLVNICGHRTSRTTLTQGTRLDARESGNNDQ
jgi:hypothetical protein